MNKRQIKSLLLAKYPESIDEVFEYLEYFDEDIAMDDEEIMEDFQEFLTK